MGKETWDLIFKTATTGVAVVGALIAVFSYLDAKDREIAVARRESQKPFLQRQLDLYFEATKITSTLATTDRSQDPTGWEKSRNRFWQLYWGELALVEDKQVEQAMIAFGNSLQTVSANPAAQASTLSPLAIDVAHACRDSIARSWDYELANVDAAQPQ